MDTKGIQGLNTFLFKTTGMRDNTELAKIVFDDKLNFNPNTVYHKDAKFNTRTQR